MTITAQQARETKIFVINNYRLTVEETTLYDHIVESAEETTSPRGVEHVLFVRENEGEEKMTYELRSWQAGGRSRLVDTFDTEEEAEEEKFQRTWNYDFMQDDQRDTMYWSTRKEAEAELEDRKKYQ